MRNITHLIHVLKATNEWQGVPDIVTLTFRGVCHVLKTQRDCIKEVEQILPAKANKQDLISQLNQKANIYDVKKTMAEVAANIESRVSFDEHRTALQEKASRSDLNLLLQDKVSFEDLKKYMNLNGGGGGTGTGASERNLELLEDQVRRMKDKLDDTYNQL